MFVDALANPLPDEATESTVLGPFCASGSPYRDNGDSIVEEPAGQPTWMHGIVRNTSGVPIAGAELDIWQNGDDRLYAVRDPDAPENHLRGRILTADDGSYAFWTVRPVPYTIPDDGPVGQMLQACGRHPWRPAHIHMIVRASGFSTLVTHILDAESEYLDSDAVFAVKPFATADVRAPHRRHRGAARIPGWRRVVFGAQRHRARGRGDPMAITDPGRTA